MKVLVTGGTGVVGAGAVTALLQRGHSVRLLSRHAERDAAQWGQGVTPWPGDVGVEASVRGAGEGCDAVLHLAAIVEERPPNATFERVNVEGTRHVVREAEVAGVDRLVYVSSLGADTGESEYQRSKRRGEEVVRTFNGNWTIMRPGAVFGPGDEHLSVLLRMIRTLPAIPVIGDGEQRFQPLWHEDLAEALAVALERPDLAGQALDLAGREVTTQRDLVARMERLTRRAPVLVPVPEMLASLGIRAIEAAGVESPFTTEQLTMLREGNVLPDDAPNALVEVLGVKPTTLDDALAKLADVQPEQLPSSGVGTLERKRFWADIRDSRLDGDALFQAVCTRFGELMPRMVDTDPEPGIHSEVVEGATLTLGLPLRGHVQVRVAEVADRSFTLLTLEGHPLAGAVRFLVEERGDCLRFEVQVYSRPAGVVDFLLMRTLGALLQDANWVTLVGNVVSAAGGQPAQVERATDSLDDEQADRIEEWLVGLVQERKRDEAGV